MQADICSERSIGQIGLRANLVRMQVIDVVASGQIKEGASVMHSKTQNPVRLEISEGTGASVAKWKEDPLMVVIVIRAAVQLTRSDRWQAISDQVERF